MNIQSQAVTSALALFPVYLPRWKTPVQPAGLAHGGIPGAAFTPNDLEVVIEPFTALKTFVMAAFDVVTLYVNGVATNVAKTILPGEENDRFLLLLPSKWFVDGVNGIFYRVTRVSGNSEDSISLTVLYHDPAPGEPAPAGVTIVFPPNIVANGVGPAEAAAGVLATFIISFARPFDEIHLSVGTWSTTFTVTDPAKPITLTLTTADFLKIGDNANTPVKCTVTDQLGNGNQSATTYLNIHLAVAEIVPTLASVRDASGKEVPEAGTTTSTTLKLTGKASNGKQVEIYDGSGPSAVPKGKATADATTGLWELTITVPAGAHRLYAKSLYHSSNVYSNVRTLTVEAGLIVDPSPLILDGFNYSIAGSGLNWIKTGNDPEGTAGRKDVSGGTPPYRYLSSSTTVASVDPTGLVRSEGNGTATITVTDDIGNSKTFDVNVTNVKTILVNHQNLYHEQGVVWINSVGGTRIVSGAVWQAFSAAVLIKYAPVSGPNLFLHTGEPNGATVYHIAITPNPSAPRNWIYKSIAANGQRPIICIR